MAVKSVNVSKKVASALCRHRVCIWLLFKKQRQVWQLVLQFSTRRSPSRTAETARTWTDLLYVFDLVGSVVFHISRQELAIMFEGERRRVKGRCWYINKLLAAPLSERVPSMISFSAWTYKLNGKGVLGWWLRTYALEGVTIVH